MAQEDEKFEDDQGFNFQNNNEDIIKHDMAYGFQQFSSMEQYKKAFTLYELKRYEEAILMLDKAIKLDPNNSLFYSDQGTLLFNLFRYEEAVLMYDKAIQFDPNNSYLYSKKGNSLYNLERYEKAIFMFDKAIELDPNRAWYYKQKVQNDMTKPLQYMIKPQNQIEIYQRFIITKGNSLHSLKRYEEAIQMYDQALELEFIKRQIYDINDIRLQIYIDMRKQTYHLLSLLKCKDLNDIKNIKIIQNFQQNIIFITFIAINIVYSVIQVIKCNTQILKLQFTVLFKIYMNIFFQQKLINSQDKHSYN